MKTHFYTSRYYHEERYKVLCTNEWTKPDETDMRLHTFGRRKAKSFVTVPENVTCADCLRKLLPKMEAKLQKMRTNLRNGTHEPVIESAIPLDPENAGGLA